MELKLNVYDGTKVKKTYTALDFTLMTGICEDIMLFVDIDKLTGGNLSQQQLGIEVFKIVAKSFSKFKPFLQDIFVGLTDDEYRHTSIKEVAKVILTIVNYTVNEMMSIGGESKN